MKGNPRRPNWFRNILISIFFSLVIFTAFRLSNAASFFVPNSTDADKFLFNYATAITAFMGTLALSIAYGLAQHESNLVASAERISKLIEDSHQFEVIGDAKKAIAVLHERVPDAIAVDNTFIKCDSSDTLSTAKYPSGWDEEWINLTVKRTTISKGDGGAIWRDIFSEDEARKKIIEEIQKRCREKNTGYMSYSAQLVHDYPTTNFIILSFRGNQKEVYFGWTGFLNNTSDNVVFKSTQPDLIEFFQQCFEELFKKKPLTQRRSKKSDQETRNG